MKTLLKSFVASLLALLARSIVRKYKPQVIMVTGSVGKTSTKDAVVSAFSKSRNVRGSEKSFNSEFGVPLTIIGAKNPWENVSRWLSVFLRAIQLLVRVEKYPDVLVLEVGADRPGDLARILKIVTPHAVVVTRLPDVPVHVEAYPSTQAVKDEEFTPAYALSEGAPLVLATDNEYALSMGKKTLAKMVTFGFATNSDVAIVAPSIFVEKGRAVGMEARLSYQGTQHPLVVRGALGTHQLLAPAAAFAVALALDISENIALEGLRCYAPPSGRMRLLSGMRHSVLIDDTYNSSPVAVDEALTALSLFPSSGKRVAILGDMLELGRYSEEEHRAVGKKVASIVDVLVLVGERSKAIEQETLRAGFLPESIKRYASSRDAVREIASLIHGEETVLIKGSQGMRMERITEALLEDAKDVRHLVRQETEWKRRS